MNYIALAALIHALPKGPGIEAAWLESTLVETLAAYRAPALAVGDPGDRDPGAWGPADEGASESQASRAWAIAGVQGTETLVQSRPVVRDPATCFVDDFLRVPSQCTIAGYGVGSDADAVPPRVAVTRFQRWVAIFAEGTLAATPEAEATIRAGLRKGLPDFLQRSLADGSDRELVGMSVIARIQAEATLHHSFVAPEIFRESLRSIDAALGAPASIHVLVSDGRTVGILHRGGEMLALRPPVIARMPRAIAVPRGQDEPPDPAIVLVYAPPGWSRPRGEASGAAVVDEGTFTVSARHPVRIERD